MSRLERDCPPDKGRGGRPILSIRTDAAAPSNCSKLAGDEQDDISPHLTDLQRFEARLWDERNAWSIRQHMLGLAGDKRLTKLTASRALAAAMKALTRSEGNALARYNQGDS